MVVAVSDALYRLTPNGRLDTAFGDGGRVALTPAAGSAQPTSVRVRAGGKSRVSLDVYTRDVVYGGDGDDVVTSNGDHAVTLFGGAGADLLRSLDPDDAFPDRDKTDTVRHLYR